MDMSKTGAMFWNITPKGKSMYFAELVFCVLEQYGTRYELSFDNYMAETSWLIDLAEQIGKGE
jgi:hypothetical protein|tara:strand:+ start:11379 stop:11567 length:189 start_codon:yes stop_codon:yes gene_type:complete